MATRKKPQATQKTRSRSSSERSFPTLLVVIIVSAVLIAAFYFLSKKGLIDLHPYEWFNQETLIKADEERYDKSTALAPVSTPSVPPSKKIDREKEPSYEQRDRDYLENLLKK